MMNTLPPAVVVHGIEEARLALAPGHPVLLLSAPGAAAYAGAGWWRALIHAADTRQPDALDCADEPGRALEALATGCRILILHPCPAFATIRQRAPHALLLTERPPALDFSQPGAARHLVPWLLGDSPAGIG